MEKTKAGVKLAALWLITNSQTSLLGICGASEARFKFETGLAPEALQSALEALPRAFKRFGDVIFVRNYVRHQFGSGDKLKKNNFFVALKSLFLSVKEKELRAFILSEYPEFEECSQRAPEGLTKPKERKGEGREGKLGSPEGALPSGVNLADGFEEFWAAYPKSKQRGQMDARRVWGDYNLAAIAPKIIEGLKRAVKSEDWKKENGKFIMSPKNWLEGRRWEDNYEGEEEGERSPTLRLPTTQELIEASDRKAEADMNDPEKEREFNDWIARMRGRKNGNS